MTHLLPKDDEEIIKNIISVLDVQVCWDGATGKKGNPYQKEIDWLKSLKDRVQPQNKCKKSLATADLENSLCDIQDEFSDTSYEYRILGEAIEFIRCTEPKPQWKPSDEQMEVLLSEVTAWSKGCPKQKVLESLYQDLKKLK